MICIHYNTLFTTSNGPTIRRITLQLKEGDRLISGSHDGSVMLWNTNQGKCMYTSSNTHTDWVTCSAASSQNASSFVTGSNDNLVILWKLETSRILPISKFLCCEIYNISIWALDAFHNSHQYNFYDFKTPQSSCCTQQCFTLLFCENYNFTLTLTVLNPPLDAERSFMFGLWLAARIFKSLGLYLRMYQIPN